MYVTLPHHKMSPKGRRELIISLSRAKFDAEAAFDVCLVVDPGKPRQISEKQNCRSVFVRRLFWGASKDEMSGTV